MLNFIIVYTLESSRDHCIGFLSSRWQTKDENGHIQSPRRQRIQQTLICTQESIKSHISTNGTSNSSTMLQHPLLPRLVTRYALPPGGSQGMCLCCVMLRAHATGDAMFPVLAMSCSVSGVCCIPCAGYDVQRFVYCVGYVVYLHLLNFL